MLQVSTHWIIYFVYTLCKNYVSISYKIHDKTQYISITEVCPVNAVLGNIRCFSENHTEHISALCKQNSESFQCYNPKQVYCALSEVYLILTKVFLCFVLSCKANARVKLPKAGHGPHSSKLLVICVVLLLFVLFYVLFVCKYVMYYCHQVTTHLRLTNIS
jgi:hypothetical protein